MRTRKSNKPSLTEALLTSIADPRDNMDRLLGQPQRPPYLVITSLVFLGICVIPPLVQVAASYQDSLRIRFLCSMAMSLMLTSIFSSILSAAAMHAAGAKQLYCRAAAALVYSTTPIAAVFLILHIASFGYSGSFTITEFIASRFYLTGDLILEMYPGIFRASLILAFITLGFGLRTLANSSLPMGLVMAAITLAIVFGSFIVSLTITDLLAPGASLQIIDFFDGFFSIPGSA